MKYISEIEDLLTGFTAYKKEIAVLKKVGGDYTNLEKKINFLEFCFSLLETYERELILSVCINGVSIRKYADHTGMSRNYISKEKGRIIEDFSRYFEIKYDSEGLVME